MSKNRSDRGADRGAGQPSRAPDTFAVVDGLQHSKSAQRKAPPPGCLQADGDAGWRRGIITLIST